MSHETPHWIDSFHALHADGIFPARVHRLYFYGPPGTGKSAAPSRLLGDSVIRVTANETSPPEDWLGSFVLRGENGATSTVWIDGPVVEAFRAGRVLVIDECDKAGADVKQALFALLDDLTQARLTLANGETVSPAPGFGVVGTSNETPDVLPPALADRFDIALLADLPAPGILDRLEPDLRAFIERRYTDQQGEARWDWSPAPSVRRLLTLQEVAQFWGRERAAAIIFGKQAPDLLTALAMHKGAK